MPSPEQYSGDTLHFSTKGTHLLFSFIQLDYFWGFVLGAVFTIGICALERLLTFAFESRWAPASIRRLRAVNAFWRAGLYWVLALLRLAYMLIAMTLNAGLILIAATTLAIGQFVIELQRRTQGGDSDYAPLEEAPMYFQDVTPRSTSKPEGIFVHPTQSNAGRADALAGNAERYPDEAAAWGEGNGPDVARSLLGHKKRGSVGPRRAPFQIGAEGDSDSDS
ncbi:hypothetical protein MVEN_01481300 [Mycena venus]|uniref:Copper transporter n=1 Tax=Mycena venus TaxID=2733690 RepID=A0A8H7CT36_9AGAR|nr:hypothetical protein MVEN_01481300 [Mycena venus]